MSGWKLEDVGKVLASGFGDRVLVGMAVGLLENSTPEGCYEWIRDNRSLIEGIPDEDWARYREIAKNIEVNLTRDNIISELRKHRLDLLGVILNHPSGIDWLDRQITEVKNKLGLD